MAQNNDALLSQRETRCFNHALGWCIVGTLCWGVQHFGHLFWLKSKLKAFVRANAHADSRRIAQEFLRLQDVAFSWMLALGVLKLFCFLAFLIMATKWLLAMKERKGMG